MKILLSLLLSVGLGWSIQPQPDIEAIPKNTTIYLEPNSNWSKVEVTTVEEEADELRKISSAATSAPAVAVTENSVPIDLSQRLFFANYYDSQFDWKTLDLSGLDLSGEDVKKVLYSINTTILPSVVNLDLSHNRVWDLPARVWPLQLEYSLRELTLDHNWLNVADPINTRTTRFELTRLRNLKKLSLSNCGLTSTLEFMEFPPILLLDLSGNQLVELPSSLTTLTKLKHLDVSGNRLRYLSTSPLGCLTGLQTLNLSHNGLEVMWDDPLEKLYSLETLHLDHNTMSQPPKLYRFTGSYQPRMEVYMGGNAFECGCSFRNIFDMERLHIVDKSNVTCFDENGVEWSLDAAPGKWCSPGWEAVRQKWSAAREWFQDSGPDWSTLCRSLGWVLFGVTLGLIYSYRRAKKASPPTSQVPYNILDDRDRAVF